MTLELDFAQLKCPVARQRRHSAKVMETIARFQYLFGRVDIGRLEIEAGIRHILGELDPPVPLPLIRVTIDRAMPGPQRFTPNADERSTMQFAVLCYGFRTLDF